MIKHPPEALAAWRVGGADPERKETMSDWIEPSDAEQADWPQPPATYVYAPVDHIETLMSDEELYHASIIPSESVPATGLEIVQESRTLLTIRPDGTVEADSLRPADETAREVFGILCNLFATYGATETGAMAKARIEALEAERDELKAKLEKAVEALEKQQ